MAQQLLVILMENGRVVRAGKGRLTRSRTRGAPLRACRARRSAKSVREVNPQRSGGYEEETGVKL